MNLISQLFWSSDDRRPRTLWRLVLFALLLAASMLAVNSLLADVFGTDLESAMGELGLFTEWRLARYLLQMALGLLAVVLPTLFAARFFDRRPVSDLGLQLTAAWWRDLCFGLLLGALLMFLVFIVELALGWITIAKTFSTRSSQSFWVALVSPLTLFLAVGIYEELVVRGYLLKNLAEGLSFGPLVGKVGMLLALLISSVTFGLAHAGNPNASAVSSFYLFLAGLLLGLPFVLTDELAIPIGLHITWNFFQGNVFGFPVSGTSANQTTFIAVEQGGPVLWTGGVFGPEAGLIGVFAIVAGSLLIIWWVKRTRGKVAFCSSVAEYQPRISVPAGTAEH